MNSQDEAVKATSNVKCLLWARMKSLENGNPRLPVQSCSRGGLCHMLPHCCKKWVCTLIQVKHGFVWKEEPSYIHMPCTG